MAPPAHEISNDLYRIAFFRTLKERPVLLSSSVMTSDAPEVKVDPAKPKATGINLKKGLQQLAIAALLIAASQDTQQPQAQKFIDNLKKTNKDVVVAAEQEVKTNPKLLEIAGSPWNEQLQIWKARDTILKENDVTLQKAMTSDGNEVVSNRTTFNLSSQFKLDPTVDSSAYTTANKGSVQDAAMKKVLSGETPVAPADQVQIVLDNTDGAQQSPSQRKMIQVDENTTLVVPKGTEIPRPLTTALKRLKAVQAKKNELKAQGTKFNSIQKLNTPQTDALAKLYKQKMIDVNNQERQSRENIDQKINLYKGGTIQINRAQNPDIVINGGEDISNSVRTEFETDFRYEMYKDAYDLDTIMEKFVEQYYEAKTNIKKAIKQTFQFFEK